MAAGWTWASRRAHMPRSQIRIARPLGLLLKSDIEIGSSISTRDPRRAPEAACNNSSDESLGRVRKSATSDPIAESRAQGVSLGFRPLVNNTTIGGGRV